jgi:multisubunit Na+/H+ antiporter MnhE subunit
MATTLGPHLSGLVTSFPIITAVLSVFTHAHRGRDEVIRLLRGFTVGFFSYAAFCFVVATTIRPLGVSGCFGLAVVLALCVQAAAVAVSQRHVLRPRQITSPESDVGAPDYT